MLVLSARMVKAYAPETVGVPANMPVPDNETPEGRAPLLNVNKSTSTAKSCRDIASFVATSGNVPVVVHVGVVSIKRVNALSAKTTLETENALTVKL